MLLTLATTHQPATDLGFLLYKNPAGVQSFELPFGKVHVFYPDAREELCRVALLLDVDPVRLVRGGGRGEGALDQYVNDRPYVASSFLSVAIAQVFGTALSGKSRERPELAKTAIPLELSISCVDCGGGEEVLKRVFEPLGYELQIDRHELDEAFPEWGQSKYYSLTLRAVTTVHDILTHAYVLIPVLDNEKHYWVGEDEVNKLLRHGEGWLPNHPHREFIVDRYLQRKRRLTRLALERLTEDEVLDPDATEEKNAHEEEAVERPLSLNERRLGSVLSVLKKASARRIIDLGCGEGRLLERLLAEKDFSELVGMDVSHRALELAGARLRYEQMSERQKERLKLIQGSLTYRDKRMTGYDAATCIEVIEHLDPPRLSAFERVIFEFARPNTVILTTPNVEYNVNFESLPAGKLRHRDHRFEWTRAEFQGWAHEVCARYKYSVQFISIGDEDPEHGPPTQMGVFTV
ncbi:MAG: 3' terminal RNA ribose 2'-O-methyltransferase Hen1 [Candidatus Melainabacteria bacterium]|jgi:3' terminal RNA ribose 2'-O-methyltransferase Hen1|nr:3' terminal RNA ribose 2'-O-methyltransferase Hen1 [Candidatus Melainabacteria bacterium]